MVRVLLGRGVGVHFYGWLVDVCFSRIPMESSKFEEKNGVEERRCGDEEKTSSGLYVYTLHTQSAQKAQSGLHYLLPSPMCCNFPAPTVYWPQPTAMCLFASPCSHCVFPHLFILHFPRPETYKVKTRWFHFLKVQWRMVAPTYFSFSVKFILKQYLEYMYKTFAKNLKGYGWFEQKKINKK